MRCIVINGFGQRRRGNVLLQIVQGGKPETRDAKSLGTEVVTQTCMGGNIFFVATVVEWALAEYTSKFTKLGTQRACVLLKEWLPGCWVSQNQAGGLAA
jgi:hypothetical protein